MFCLLKISRLENSEEVKQITEGIIFLGIDNVMVN